MSDQVDGTWEEARFRNAQQHSADHEASKVLDKARESHDGAPADNEHPDIMRGAFELLEQDI